MLTTGKKEFWFVVGSQHLYGEETLAEVRAHAQAMTDALNAFNASVMACACALTSANVSSP